MLPTLSVSVAGSNTRALMYAVLSVTSYYQHHHAKDSSCDVETGHSHSDAHLYLLVDDAAIDIIR